MQSWQTPPHRKSAAGENQTDTKNEALKDGIKENLGDTMWYIAMICNFYGWNLEEVLEENIEKLKKRYPDGFTYKNAQREGTMTDWNES